MSIYSLFNDVYDPFPMFGRRSVYVISDSEMAKYKQAQAQREIVELEKLVDGHKQSIERLESTIESLKAELPQLPETTEQPSPA